MGLGIVWTETDVRHDAWYMNQGYVPDQIAEKLGMPHATIIMEVQKSDAGLRVKRELEGGWFQWVGLPMPALLR